jgi:outer membrane protein TolC
VAASYYNAQLARENIDIARADEQFNQRLLEEAQARRRVGTGSLSDELNFKVRVNAARSVVYQSQREYAVALIGLAELMGVPTAALSPDTQLSELEEEKKQELQLPEADPLINYALANRPDLEATEWAVKRTDANVGVAKSAFYPEVTVSAGKDALRSDNAEFGEDDFGTSVALNLSYTLFAGGRNRAAYAEAKSARREAERNLDAAEITVTADVRQALENLRNAQLELQLQRENADLVQRNRDLVEKEYKAGVGFLVRLNEAQRDLVQAQARLATALVALRGAWFQLQTATAESLNRFRGESSPVAE